MNCQESLSSETSPLTLYYLHLLSEDPEGWPDLIHGSPEQGQGAGEQAALLQGLLSLAELEVSLERAGSPTAKNNPRLPICDRNLRKHIVKFREGLIMVISPNPFVFWH